MVTVYVACVHTCRNGSGGGFTLGVLLWTKWYRCELGFELYLHTSKYQLLFPSVLKLCAVSSQWHCEVEHSGFSSLLLSDWQTDASTETLPPQSRRLPRGRLLVWAFLQSISRLIKLVSITKGFPWRQSNPFFVEVKGAVHLLLLRMSYLAMQMFF